MEANRKYILIKSSQQSERYIRTNAADFMINIEDYLFEQSIDYEIGPKSRKVYVIDKNTALRIGTSLQLQSIEYFDGNLLKTIELRKQPSGKRRQAVYVETLDSGSRKTLKQFKAEKKIRAESEGILKSEIISTKLATKKDLEEMITKYNLHVTKFGGKLYLDQIEFANALVKHTSSH